MEEINLIEVYQYFKQRLLWIIITVLFVMILGNVYTLATRVPMYKSDTKVVLVNSSNSNTYSQSELMVNQNLVTTYSEIVKSRKVLNQVIKNLNLKTTEEELRKKITVSAVNDTEIIRIEVSDEDANVAKNITNEVADVFVREIKEFYNMDNVSVLDKAVRATSAYNLTYVKDNAIFVLLGLVLSCGTIFVIYYFDTTIKSSEMIEEKLGLTVLGVVPLEKRGN